VLDVGHRPQHRRQRDAHLGNRSGRFGSALSPDLVEAGGQLRQGGANLGPAILAH
jgi:hypothetical protein